MKDDKIARYTVRVPKEILSKVGYIADYNGRTKNKELEQMMKARISAFEQKVGKISIDEEESGSGDGTHGS